MFTYPVRNSRNPSFWMLMPAPRVQTSETPSSMLRNPSVTISGLIRNAVISRPWTTPTSAPAATAIRIAAQAGIPCAIGPPAMFVPAIRMAATTPLNETIASTDRSMPPVRMTKVCPTATTPIAAASRPISSRPVGVRNAGAVSHSPRNMTSSTASGPVFGRMFRMNPPTRRVVCSREVVVWLIVFRSELARDSMPVYRSLWHTP